MPKHKLLQIGNITSRMADRLEADFHIIEYFKFQNKEKLISDHAKEIISIQIINFKVYSKSQLDYTKAKDYIIQ